MGNCKNCKDWTPTKSDIGGYCGSLKIGEPNDVRYEADTMVYSYVESGSFWTGPEFGCIHFRKKRCVKP